MDRGNKVVGGILEGLKEQKSREIYEAGKKPSFGRKPKNWDSMFSLDVIAAYKNGELKNSKDIAEWDKRYNGGVVPRPAFNTREIIDYYNKVGKAPNESFDDEDDEDIEELDEDIDLNMEKIKVNLGYALAKLEEFSKKPFGSKGMDYILKSKKELGIFLDTGDDRNLSSSLRNLSAEVDKAIKLISEAEKSIFWAAGMISKLK